MTMGKPDRILSLLVAVLVAYLPFEFRLFPLLSNLQWLFLAASAAGLPIMIRDRKMLLQDRLVLAALVFVVTQWLAALLAQEFTGNAVKAALRVSCVRDRRGLLQIWAVSALLAAFYAILDYNGFGLAGLFREADFYFGPVVRLSGSFEYPNTAAAFFSLSLPIFWTTAKPQWVRILGSLLIWIALVMTYSRGAILAVLLVLLSWALMGRARTAVYCGSLCVAALIGLLPFHPALLERFREQAPVKVLSAEYEPEFNLLSERPDELSDLVVRVKNNGTAAWPATADQPLTLSYWWIDPEQKKPFQPDTIYTPIPGPVRPHESPK